MAWTRRGGDVSDSWALPEAVNEGVFVVEARLGGAIVETQQVEAAAAAIAAGADEVRVAQIGEDGRMGAWASISVLAA